MFSSSLYTIYLSLCAFSLKYTDDGFSLRRSNSPGILFS